MVWKHPQKDWQRCESGHQGEQPTVMARSACDEAIQGQKLTFPSIASPRSQ
jgi:hypothetical protein